MALAGTALALALAGDAAALDVILVGDGPKERRERESGGLEELKSREGEKLLD